MHPSRQFQLGMLAVGGLFIVLTLTSCALRPVHEPTGLSARAPTAQAPAALPPDNATAHHSFDDVAKWTKVFDDPGRDEWQKPRELVAALSLHPGMRVADLGAGTGYFSRYLSSAVGEEGTVFAVDPEPNMIVYLRQRAEQEKTANVVPVLASTDAARLPAGSIDLVLVVDTYHHIDRRRDYFRQLRRSLTRHGRVAIVDWQKRDLPVGPPPPHKLPREQVVAEMNAAGYTLIEEPQVLPYQYVLIFQAR